ncbi:CshA domain-containing protein [Arthrobacter ulcerisalmonis]
MKPSSEPKGSSFYKKTGGAALTVALITGGFISLPQPAFAANPFPDTGMYATKANSSDILSVNLATGATTTVLTVPGAPTGLNQIGLSNNGNKMMLTNGSSVFEYTASTETWETVARSAPLVPNTMGGVNPVNSVFYFGGVVTGTSTFNFKSFDPATNSFGASIISVTTPGVPPGGNGDLAFDSLGNMYFIASSATAAQVYRVDATQLAAGSGTATKIGPQIASGVALNSMAFGKDGFLYIAGSGANGFLRVNPITGVVLERKSLDASITDLGSSSLPFTGSVRVDLPEQRVKDTDQFTVTLEGGGLSTGNSATTANTEPSKAVGPLLILPGETYTITQTPAGTTDPALYQTSWTCIDPSSGATIASGPGTSGSFTIPNGVQNVSCSFTSVPYPDPVASPDISENNPKGSTVSVPVLSNDAGDIVPSSVKLITATGDPVTELVVPGQGTWSVNPETGVVSFDPEEGFTGNPTPVTYQVTDVRGNSSESTVTITYSVPPEVIPDVSSNNTQGSTVSVPVLGNDKGDFDPTTVNILDGDNKPVKELIVPGQGTWSVNPETGVVSFDPEEGFTGNPTPVTYQVTDKTGNTATATVTITYTPIATEPPVVVPPTAGGSTDPGSVPSSENTDPTDTSSGGELASTGVQAMVLGVVGLGLLLLGGAVILVTRRRRHS